MVMEETTSPLKKTPTKSIFCVRSHNKSNEKEKCYRKNKSNKVAKPSFHSTKERHHRREVNSGFVHTKHIYSMPRFQDANNKGSEIAAAQKFLDGFSGPKRRVLAHSNKSFKKTLFRVHVPKPVLAVSSNAIRPQYSATNIYQSNGTCCEKNGRSRHMGPTLSRRSSNHSSVKRRMFKEKRPSIRDSERVRNACKSKEISIRSSANFRMARSPIQFDKAFSKEYSRKKFVSPGKSHRSNKERCLFKKRNYETSRVSKLDGSMRSSHKTINDSYKKDPETIQEERAGCSNMLKQGVKAQSLQVDFNFSNSTMSRSSGSRHFNPDRCIPKRVGDYVKSKKNGRIFRPVNERIFNKHARITSSLVFSSLNSRKEQSNSSSVRQLHSSRSSQKRVFSNLPPVISNRDDLEENSFTKLESFNSPHKRVVQCNSRPIIKKLNNLHRMVTVSQGFQRVDSQMESGTSNRLVCNKSKQQVAEILFPMSRLDSDSSGCSIHSMGQVGSPIHVSPREHDFQGFSKDDQLKFCKNSISDARDANQTLVHGVEITQSSFILDKSVTSTISSRQNGIQTNFNSSRLETIESAYKEKFPDCDRAVKLISKPLRNNSVNDYQHKWKVFIEFLVEKKISPSEVSICHVLNFFSFLFYEKKLKASTVSHYRTAISVPLLLQYKVDLQVPEVSFLLKSMSIERPNIPISTPAWSLNKVLIHLDNLPEPLSNIMLLRKTAFLLLLATGWRISELHACVRNEEFCKFSQNSSLRIRPHPNFLAKNESTINRWPHKEVKRLLLKDGSVSKLCPVASLQEYLQRTSHSSKGELFLHHDGIQKISVNQLSIQICKLILEADPNTKSRVHDVRKYASSYSLAETMLVGDLVSSIHWSSPTIFFKFYLTPTDPLVLPVSLPGVTTSGV